jgi:hypothetical protein
MALAAFDGKTEAARLSVRAPIEIGVIRHSIRTNKNGALWFQGSHFRKQVNGTLPDAANPPPPAAAGISPSRSICS